MLTLYMEEETQHGPWMASSSPRKYVKVFYNSAKLFLVPASHASWMELTVIKELMVG